MGRAPRTFLITGATGFLGKVVLEELIRRRDELEVDRVALLVRPLGGRSARERFDREVVRAECFRHLRDGWTSMVSVLESQLDEGALVGLRDEDAVLPCITHVVHAAASVKFHLPVPQAARINITASLNVFELARMLPRLERFVYVSTAYVTPANGGAPIEERPVSLPIDAGALYDTCLRGSSDERELLARTGHPNSYTLTKAVAEQLLVDRRGSVPLTIIRPSIITAARRHPLPAWIDSPSGFASFVLAIGSGHFGALVCDPEARLDLIPVDDVSTRIIDAATNDEDGLVIRHAVVGRSKAPAAVNCWDVTREWFRAHPVDRLPAGRYLGPRNLRFRIADLTRHRIPVFAARFGSRAQRRQAEKRAARMEYLNEEFTYFTTHTFDFRSSRPIDDHYDGDELVRTVARGVYRHLLRRDERAWVLGGRAHTGHGGDARWVARQPHGNGWIRFAAWAATKLLRRSVDRVTVDLTSFERARRLAPEGATWVITPSHRSYLDFVLCAYLAFARPDLMSIPHFAATMEFARIPVLGRILKAMHAFYLRRGVGKDPELDRRVEELIREGSTLAFFIEGARSRSGEFLPPKRGLLRCLQVTGRQCALMPIAIAYDRVPERDAFDRELAGHPKPRMRLGPLVGWVLDVLRGKVDLGAIHIACGEPVLIDPASDARAVAGQVIEQLRGAMAGSTSRVRQPAKLSSDWTPAPSKGEELLAAATAAT